MYINSLIEAIGQTPMLKLARFAPEKDLFAKLEMQNPGGSVKDRAALYMIKDAEDRGLLKPGGAIVEPTSGNTGIGLAWISAILGYKLTLTMPDSMSIERRRIFAAYGANVELTPGAKGMAGAIAKAEEIARETGAFMPMQFENPANPKSHMETTAQEILRQMNGDIGALVATVGSGGTLSGVAGALKKRLPKLRVFAVEPEESPVLSGGKPGPHGIQGIGAGFVPKNLDTALIDEIIRVTTADAFKEARRIAKTEGVFCGISSGAALCAALAINLPRTVVILPDTGDRYLSTELFG